MLSFEVNKDVYISDPLKPALYLAWFLRHCVSTLNNA